MKRLRKIKKTGYFGTKDEWQIDANDVEDIKDEARRLGMEFVALEDMESLNCLYLDDPDDPNG